jgi:hypothetical protein
MAVKRPNDLSLQDTPKFTQIGILGSKIYHLATLVIYIRASCKPSHKKPHSAEVINFFHLFSQKRILICQFKRIFETSEAGCLMNAVEEVQSM